MYYNFSEITENVILYVLLGHKLSWLSTYIFFIILLPWLPEKYNKVNSRYFLHDFEFRDVLPNWLLTKTTEPNLLYYLTHSCGVEKKRIPNKICAKVNPEFELGLHNTSYASRHTLTENRDARRRWYISNLSLTFKLDVYGILIWTPRWLQVPFIYPTSFPHLWTLVNSVAIREELKSNIQRYVLHRFKQSQSSYLHCILSIVPAQR